LFITFASYILHMDFLGEKPNTNSVKKLTKELNNNNSKRAEIRRIKTTM